jgi:hypothetical protein
MPFTNRNVCKTFTIPTLTSPAKIQLADQECSEVIVTVSSGGNAVIYDPQSAVGFTLPAGFAGQEFTFRGLTNANQLSATGSGTLYYRTQFFSFFPEVR